MAPLLLAAAPVLGQLASSVVGQLAQALNPAAKPQSPHVEQAMAQARQAGSDLSINTY